MVVVIAGSWLGYRQLSDRGCNGRIALNVATATEITPAVEQAAQQWVADGANVGGTCVIVNVSGVNPAQMAAAVAREHRVALTGLGTAPQSVRVPDVWIPDSSSWLQRLNSQASGFTPADNNPIALSPVVVAMPTPVAEKFGWPARKLGWKDLLGEMSRSDSGRTGIVDPTRDAAGLAGLLALASAAPADSKGQVAKVGALRALAAGSSALRDDLLERFSRSADVAGTTPGLSAAPLSEQDVIAFNAGRPPIQLAALYLDPQPPGLNYPFAVMPEVDPQRSAAAAGLRTALNSASFRKALATAGLRAADGTTGEGFALPVGAPGAVQPAPDPRGAQSEGASSINQALGSWAAITLPGRTLAVFDISGSMSKKVPTAGGASRNDVTKATALQGLQLFDDKWSMGFWVFSTDLVGERPWKEIVPISPLSTSRRAVQAAVSSTRPKPDGGTGLYDTALAAYKEVQDGWVAGRVNSVMLFTDGQNSNKGGITKAQLVAALRKANDPKRPIRMVVIGIGEEVDQNELETITNATSAGGVFISRDPAKIGDIFLEAMSSRTGAKS